MDESLIDKLIKLIRHALGFRENPVVICSQSRVSCEAILREVYRKEIGDPPAKMMFDQLCKTIQKQCPGAIPQSILAFIGTIQIYGNLASHPSEELEELSSAHAQMVETALTAVCNWFFNDYLKLNLDRHQFSGETGTSEKHSIENYRELVRSALSGPRFEIAHYEDILEARKSLDLGTAEAEAVERALVQEIQHRSNASLKDILEPFELESLKNIETEPHFSARLAALLEERKTLGPGNPFNQLLDTYTDFLGGKVLFTGDPLFILTGCWQGWYAQSGAKTYFDLIILVENKTSFKGITLEPLHPGWGVTRFGKIEWLFADIKGSYEDEYLVSFSKTYRLKEPWTIDYRGIALDGGTYFEGDWAVKTAEGSFNAIKTKTLMPVRIFDTENNRPLVSARQPKSLPYLNGVWLVRLSGKCHQLALLFLVQRGRKVFANLFSERDNQLSLLYLEGEFSSKVLFTLQTAGAVVGDDAEIHLKLSIDRSEKSLSGTARMNDALMLSVKGEPI